jgi:vitamin B12 transporter
MTIVVTATRIPEPIGQVGVTTSVVTDKQMETQQVTNAIDSLREVPGVQITQTGSPGTVAQPSIRGASSSESLTMIDGVPVNTGSAGGFDLSHITTGDLDRIEVVRGAGGALYGSAAIGGVVNVLSREGSGPPQFSLLSEGGNRASVNQVATFGGADGRLAYSGSLNYFSTTGFRPVNDNSDNLAGALRLDYHLDENTTLRGFARYIRANTSLANFSISSGIPLNSNAHERSEFMLFKGELDRQIGERLMVRVSAFFVRDDERTNALPIVGFPFMETDQNPDETRGTNIDGIYTWNSTFRTLVGFEFLDRWAHAQDDFYIPAPPPPPLRFLTIYNARRQEYGGYVEQEAHLFDDHLIATGGFRMDGNSQFGEEVSPAWSVAIPLNDYGVTLRGNYAEGFRAPDFNDLYLPGFGNPSLGPELSSEYDGGITKTLGEIASVTATYFSRRVHNQIVAVPCGPFGPSCLFGSLAGNAGRVDTQGVEFNPELTPIKGMELGGYFTYLDQHHDPALFKRQPLRVAKYSASAHAQYVHANLLRSGDDATAAMIYTFVGDRDDIAPTASIQNHEAYNRVDLAVSYSPGIRFSLIRNERFVARIQNLFDRHYAEALGFPAPPINFLAGVRLDF